MSTSGIIEVVDITATVYFEGEGNFELPITMLPKNIKEGDYIKIDVVLDPEAKKLAQEDIEVGGRQKDQKVFYGKFKEEF